MEGLIVTRELTSKDSKTKEYEFFKKIMKDFEKIPLEEWEYEFKSSVLSGGGKHYGGLHLFALEKEELY